MISLLFRQTRSINRDGLLLKALALCVLLTLALGSLESSYAQSIVWEDPVNISNSPSFNSNFASVVVDRANRVHVIWCETPIEEGALCKAIYYTSFDGVAWSLPVDIIIAEGTTRIDDPSLTIDSAGILHLVWVGGYADRILYSHAYAPSAGSAQNWSEPVAVGDLIPLASSPDLAVDASDRLHLVYTIIQGAQSGIYYSRLGEHKNAIAQQSTVFANTAEDRILSGSRLAVDPEGGLHVAWAESSYPDSFPPLGLRYAHSFDDGDTWSEPILIQGPYSASGLLALSGSEIHLVWSGTSPDRFKFHSWSRDRGVTWTPPVHTREQGGQQGWPALAVDSDGGVHLLQVAGSTDETLTHQVWRGSGWSPPVTLLGRVPSSPNHATNPDLAVGLGNQLHTVVTQILESPTGSGNWQFEIYYLHAVVNDVAGKIPEPLPALDAGPTAIAPSTDIPQPTSQATLATPLTQVFEKTNVAQETTNTTSAVLIGVFAAGLVVLGTVAVNLRRKRR